MINMTDEEKKRREAQAAEALLVASLGNKTVSEEELKAVQEFEEGKKDLCDLETELDDMQAHLSEKI